MITAIAWKLVTDRYIKLIAMKHVSELLQMPQTRRGDTTSLRQLINHVASHSNAIEALTLNASMHTLILNHLLSVLDSETQGMGAARGKERGRSVYNTGPGISRTTLQGIGTNTDQPRNKLYNCIQRAHVVKVR
jgi:hypothetical protein